MTLHWWMHWFWVTAQLAAVLATPLPSTTREPQARLADQITTSDAPLASTTVVPAGAQPTESRPKENFRVAKAIGESVQPDKSDPTGRSDITRSGAPISVPSTASAAWNASVDVNVANGSDADVSRAANEANPSSIHADRTVGRTPNSKKDSKITWILTTNKTGRGKLDEKSRNDSGAAAPGNSSAEESEDLAVLPLREEASRFKLVLNKTKSVARSSADETRAGNRSVDVEIDEELSEPRVLVTAASVLQGSGEATRLSRARSAFASDFRRDQAENQSLEDVDPGSVSVVYGDGRGNPGNSTSAVDIAAITGSCLASVILLSTMGSLGFIMYRKRYLNPPQTLNSDKCSNPDSSGYIDDSTIRDNSEEMYSLDNDSFLNSLEAMTIQNYWTDSVKHTKL